MFMKNQENRIQDPGERLTLSRSRDTREGKVAGKVGQ